MHELYGLFPALRDISHQLPDVLDKCQTVTTHYLEKHLELLNLAKKYKYYFDLFMHLIKNFGKNVDSLGKLDIPEDLLNNIEPLKEEQAKIMKEYENIVQFYEAKGISFENAYKELENHIIELFQSVVIDKQDFRSFKEADEYAEQLNYFYQNEQAHTIKADFPHLSGLIQENGKYYIVFISPHKIRDDSEDHEYKAKKIEISDAQYSHVLKRIVLKDDIPFKEDT